MMTSLMSFWCLQEILQDMSENLGDILKKLGWDDSFQVPVANEGNKALERELLNISLKKNKAKNELEVLTGRLDALKDHFKFVSQESEQTQVGWFLITYFLIK